MGVGGQRHAPAALPPGKTLYPLYRRLGWPPGPVWTGAEKLAPPTGIRSPDRPPRSESLYRLSYPGPTTCIVNMKATFFFYFNPLLLQCVQGHLVTFLTISLMKNQHSFCDWVGPASSLCHSELLNVCVFIPKPSAPNHCTNTPFHSTVITVRQRDVSPYDSSHVT
jgi:hypothetical protein